VPDTGHEAEPYRLKVPKAFEKDIKKLHRQLQASLNQHLEKIANSPQSSGVALKGDLEGLLEYKFRFQGTEYRIVYEVLEAEQAISLIMVGSRESFFERLSRRIG
jgi:mRNA-degrading endonuclease RelE of RelBE toxin-antitoxin system